MVTSHGSLPRTIPIKSHILGKPLSHAKTGHGTSQKKKMKKKKKTDKQTNKQKTSL